MLINYIFKGNFFFKPLKLIIEPTNACNLACIMCPHKDMVRKIGFMDIELYKKIIDESNDFVQEYQISLVGEPTLHPKIIDMITYSCLKSNFTNLYTNATLLDDILCNKIIKSGLDNIYLTVDGETKETYEKIRQNANFESTIENVIRLINIRSKLKSKKPNINLQIIEMKENINEIHKFIDRFKKFQIDNLIIRPYDTWAGNLEILSHSPFTNPSKKRKKKCTQLWTTMVITWNGDVIPCCRDYDANSIIGNIKERQILDIWNSEKMKYFRKNHMNLKLCENCYEWNREFDVKRHIFPFIKRHIGIAFKNL